MTTERDVNRPHSEAESQPAKEATEAAEAAQQDLTLGEAATLYDISRSSLRRKLKAKKIPGAYQIAGPQTDEWRIPRASFEKMRVPARVGDEGSEPSGGPEVGALSGYFINAIRRERSKRLGVEAAKLEVEAKTVGLNAESEKLRKELVDRRRQLAAAENQRATVERDTEAARIAAWNAAVQLENERKRREEAETHSAAVAVPPLAQTWGARIGWSVFGVAATLGAILLVASLLVDSLLFDRGPSRWSREETVSPTDVSSTYLSPSAEGAEGSEWIVASTARPGDTQRASREGRQGRRAFLPTGRRRGVDPGNKFGAGPGSGPVDTPDSGPKSGPGGGSDGPTGEGSSGSDTPSGSGSSGPGDGSSGSGSGAVGSATGAAAGVTGDAAQGVADTVGDAVDNATGTTGSTAGSAGTCVCGAAAGGADATGSAAGSTEAAATGAVGDAVPPLP
jgi:hypothetical protein